MHKINKYHLNTSKLMSIKISEDYSTPLLKDGSSDLFVPHDFDEVIFVPSTIHKFWYTEEYAQNK